MDIDSTLLTLISVTVLLPGGPIHPHQLLQPAGQAVDGHAGSTQLCTLSASNISLAHSFIPAISALAQPSSWLLCSELLTNSPACSSICLMVLSLLFLTSPSTFFQILCHCALLCLEELPQLPGLCLTLLELLYQIF